MKKIVKPFTDKQIKTIDDVMDAIARAEKAGVVFYGQCESLVAMRKEYSKYCTTTKGWNECGGVSYDDSRAIPVIINVAIQDSGADDTLIFNHNFYEDNNITPNDLPKEINPYVGVSK